MYFYLLGNVIWLLWISVSLFSQMNRASVIEKTNTTMWKFCARSLSIIYLQIWILKGNRALQAKGGVL